MNQPDQLIRELLNAQLRRVQFNVTSCSEQRLDELELLEDFSAFSGGSAV